MSKLNRNNLTFAAYLILSMIVAVTGANGHVGVNLCKSLVSLGHEVRAFTHNSSAALAAIPVQIVQGDMLDRKTLYPLLNGAEVVFHLAARISIAGDPDGMVLRINSEGVKNITEISMEVGVKRFIHFSSIHAFQQHPFDKPLDENRPLVTNHGFSYDLSKAAGERTVMQAVKQGLNAIVLSPTAIIGPADPEPSLIGQAVLDLYNKKIPSLVPGGYDWVDVRDVVDAAISAMHHGRIGEKYLLSGSWHSLKEFSALISHHSGKQCVQAVLPFWVARIGLPFITLYSKMTGSKPLYTSESLTIIGEGNRMISNIKARNELGFKPRPLTESIGDMLLWFRQNGYIK